MVSWPRHRKASQRMQDPARLGVQRGVPGARRKARGPRRASGSGATHQAASPPGPPSTHLVPQAVGQASEGPLGGSIRAVPGKPCAPKGAEGWHLARGARHELPAVLQAAPPNTYTSTLCLPAVAALPRALRSPQMAAAEAMMTTCPLRRVCMPGSTALMVFTVPR